MSFILDALKKSENDRQSQAEAEFSAVPSSPDAPATPRWLWVFGALLVINALVLFGFVLRDDPPSSPASLPAAGAATVTPVERNPASNQSSGNTASFASQLEARRQQPAVADSETETAPAATSRQIAPTTTQRPAVSVANLPVSRAAVLPTLMELRTNGTLQLPDLHLDIHVYNNVPANRFVFIDMNKYQENSQLDSGPTVQEITSDGVILAYQGVTFLLPRE